MNWFRKTILSPRFWLGMPKYKRRPSNLSVTVVIPAWNEEDFILETMESLRQQDYPHKLIVVNDRSTDRTSELAKKFAQYHRPLYPFGVSALDYHVQVIDVEEKAGSKSQALNKALPYIDTDVFVCVDADTELERDSLSRLMMAFNNPNVAVASGFVVSKHDRNFWQRARRGEYIVGQAITKSAQENMNAVLVASGCFFAIRSEVLKQHGFDDATMAEDMDLTWTAVEDGWDVAFVQDAYCYVTDPDSWYLYHKQLHRWYAGLFQCIKKRRFNLFTKNPKLGIAVYFYTLMSLIGTPIWIAFIIWGATVSVGGVMVYSIFMYLCLFIPAMIHGIWTGRDINHYPSYIACTMLAGPINFYIFAKAGYQEMFTKHKLTEWVKGH